MPAPTPCWCSTSTASWPRTTAEDFVAKMLGEQIGAAAVVTGEDFTFGKGRAGNADGAARAWARRTASPPRPWRRCCSTASGSPPAASARRCRPPTRRPRPDCSPAPFAIEGEVEHGDERGRELGWPTANMRLGNYLRPAYGIYAVRVRARRRQRA